MKEAEASSGRAWWTVAVLAITMFASFIDRHILVLLITPIKQSLRLSDTQVSLLIGVAFSIFYLLSAIPLARLIDRGNRRLALAGSALLWSTATAAFALAHSYTALLFARMAQGVGSSVTAPASLSIIGDLFRRDQLARPIAVVNVGGAIGSALALLLGGLLLGWVDGMAAGPRFVEWLEPWQWTLLVAAAPGPLIALLILSTVAEPARRADPGARASLALATVVGHLVRFRSAYLPIILATGVNSTLVLGLVVWSPSLLERKFGWAVGDPGLYLGAIVLLVAPLGLLFGGWLADWRAARGDVAANMRVVLWASFGLAPLAMLYPMMPSARLSLVVLSIALFFAMMGLGPASAAVQRITPDTMRATVTAIYVATVNLLGYGLGPLLVALFTDGIFGSETKLAMSMALLSITLAPIGLVVNMLAFRPYRRAVEQAQSLGK